MPKFKRKDVRESAPKGTARRTLNKARFFLDQADRSERHIAAYECYVEAALIFARSVLGHLRKEFGRKRGFDNWIKLRERDPSIKDLIDRRDVLIHVRTMGSIPSEEDAFFYEGLYDQASQEVKAAHEMLRKQLDEMEAIIGECEKRFK